MLAAFIVQFYDDKPPPPLLLLSQEVPESALIAEALALKAGRRVELAVPQRGEKRGVLDHAVTNAREALERRLAEGAGQAKLLACVADLFGLEEPPVRIETYDNSHIMGTNAYGVMVVAGPEGFTRNAYRKYSIRGPIAPGDDFAMMREVLERRFGRALKEQPNPEGRLDWPDLLLVDGGAGQYSAVRSVLDDLGVERRQAGRDRQGARSRCRARMVPHRHAAGLPAAAARPGPVLPAAAARRGAPLCHHHASRRTIESHLALGAGRDPRHRCCAQARPCSTISARRAGSSRPGSPTWRQRPGSAGRPRARSTAISIEPDRCCSGVRGDAVRRLPAIKSAGRAVRVETARNQHSRDASRADKAVRFVRNRALD